MSSDIEPTNGPAPVPDRRDWNPHFPDHIVAAAHDLLRRGYSLRTCERKLREQFPGERIPTNPTIGNWERHLCNSLQSESESRETRIIAAADDLIATTLDEIAEGDPKSRRYALQTMNSVQGTYRDKQQRRIESKDGIRTHAGPFVIFQNIQLQPPAQPPAIEGEPPTPARERERERG